MPNAAQLLRRRIANAIAEATTRPEIVGVHHEARTIPPSRGVHVRGFHPVRPGHPQIAFESKLERDFISAIAYTAGFRALRSQPLTVRYREDGRARHYTPDFHLTLEQIPTALRAVGLSVTTLIEIKPLAKAEAQFDEIVSKFYAIRSATPLSIVLITEIEVYELLSSAEVRHVA